MVIGWASSRWFGDAAASAISFTPEMEDTRGGVSPQVVARSADDSVPTTVISAGLTDPESEPEARANPDRTDVADTGQEVLETQEVEGLHGILEATAEALNAPGEHTATVISGSWHDELDELVQTDSSRGNMIIAFGESDWHEFDFEAEAMRVAGSNGIRLVFHLQDAKNFRAFTIGDYGNKGVDITTTRNGAWQRDKQVFHPADSIGNGRWYRLRIEVRGAEVRGYLDGNLVVEGSDPDLTSGRVGLASWASRVRFRNIVVREPLGGVLWEGLPEVAGAPPHGSAGFVESDGESPGEPEGSSAAVANRTWDASRVGAVEASWATGPLPGGREATADVDESFAEVARIARFPYCINGPDDYYAGAVGLVSGFGRDQSCIADLVALRAARRQVEDSLVTAAATCEDVLLDAWRLSRAYDELGLWRLEQDANDEFIAGLIDAAAESEDLRHEAAMLGKSLGKLVVNGGVQYVIGAAELDLQSRLAGTWAADLLPHFEAAAGPVTETHMVAIGTADKLCPAPKGQAGWPFGTLALRSRSGLTLTRAAVRVVLSDEAGNDCPWFGYFDSLSPSTTIVLQPSGLYLLRDALGHSGPATLAKPLRATISVFAAEGRDVDRLFEFPAGPPPPNRAPFTESERIAFRDEFVESMRVASRVVPLLRQTLAEAFPLPLNPVVARSRLVEVFGGGASFGIYSDSGTLASVIHLDAFESETETIYGLLVFVDGRRVVLHARFVDELDRGCVIAVTDRRLLENGQSIGGAQAMLAAAVRPDVAWITAPFAIWGGARRIDFGQTLGDFLVTFNELHHGMKGPPNSARVAGPCAKPWLVLHLDEDMAPWLQELADTRVHVTETRLKPHE